MKRLNTLGLSLLLCGIVFLNGNPAFATQSKYSVASYIHKEEITKEFLKEVKTLASEGKAINSEEFGIGSKKDEIIAKWGNPDSDGNGLMEYYEKKVNFTVDSDGVVESVQTEDERLSELNQDQINKTFGEPIEYGCGAGQCYGLHQAGGNFVSIHWNNGIIKPGKLLLQNVTIHRTKPY